MNIIFGRDNAVAMREKYTVLELDTFHLPDDQEIVAFCAVENIPLLELPKVESMQSLHENLLINYRKRDWNYCKQALEHLMGFWNHELDTFYQDLLNRIDSYDDTSDDTWDWRIKKNPS